MDDLAVPEVHQVADSEPSAFDLVDPHRPSRPGEVAFDQHDGHADGPAPRDLQCVVLAGDDDDPLDALAAKVLDGIIEERTGQGR